MRLVWGALLLVHLWPLATIVGRLIESATLRDLGSLAVLAVLLPLFALKAIDFRAARTNRPFIEFIIWLVCAGLAHSGPIGDSPFATAPVETAIVATVVVAVASRRLRRRLCDWLTGLLARVRRALPGRLRSIASASAWLDGVGIWWARRCVLQRIAARPPPSF